MIEEKEWITLREAKKIISITPDTLKNWIKKGKITGRKLGKRYFVLASELKERNDLSNKN